MTLRQPHDCTRCDARIHPGEEFAAVDVLDPDGEIQTLLCPACATALREFLDVSDDAADAVIPERDDSV